MWDCAYILFPSSLITFTLITLNFFSGRLPLSLHHLVLMWFYPICICSFVPYVFPCHHISFYMYVVGLLCFSIMEMWPSVECPMHLSRALLLITQGSGTNWSQDRVVYMVVNMGAYIKNIVVTVYLFKMITSLANKSFSPPHYLVMSQLTSVYIVYPLINILY